MNVAGNVDRSILAQENRGRILYVEQGSNVVYNEAADRINVPPLLPYLVDRSSQEQVLEKEMKKQIHRQPPYPIVYLLHGDEDQGHNRFIDRVVFRLQELIPSATATNRPDLLDCSAPSSREAMFQRWWSRLAKLYPQAASAEELAPLDIAAAIAREKVPLVLTAWLHSSEWPSGIDLALTYLLEFFESWPAMPDGAYVIVVISLLYDYAPGLWRGWRYRRYRSSLNEHVERLTDAEQLKLRYGRTQPILLPRLESVTAADADRWAVAPDTCDFCNSAGLRQQVKEIYQKQGVDVLPMDRLARELMLILLQEKELAG